MKVNIRLIVAMFLINSSCNFANENYAELDNSIWVYMDWNNNEQVDYREIIFNDDEVVFQSYLSGFNPASVVYHVEGNIIHVPPLSATGELRSDNLVYSTKHEPSKIYTLYKGSTTESACVRMIKSILNDIDSSPSQEYLISLREILWDNCFPEFHIKSKADSINETL